MTRAQCAEITEVRARLVAAAKATGPVTRRAAAQLREDLAQWQSWVADGMSLPRLPRRIRIGLAKPVKKKDLKNKSEENVLNPKPATSRNRAEGISQDKARSLLGADYEKYRAIAMALIRRESLADECVAECVASALVQIDRGSVSFESAAKFHAWIRQIVRWNARRVMRKAIYVAVSDVDFNLADRVYDDERQSGNVLCDEFGNQLWGIATRRPNLDEQ
ncbi:MAG TPA: hypothetical protein VGK01_11885 [Candidatus Angelobacter sp.]|jgi:hypothetical protein